jgi:hypothetical protein
MARSDTRYSVYPAPKAVEIIGNSAPALNQGIECWAALLARAMADNAETFSAFYSDWDGFTLHEKCLHDWALLATVLRGLRFDSDFANPGELLATAVEDAHRLEKTGREWFASDGDIEWKEVDAAVRKLVEKLRSKDLDYTHAWAIIVAVQWFWEHHEQGIDIGKDPWWTLTFRRKWKPKHAPKGQGHSTDRKQGNRKKTETSKRD